MYLTCGCFQNAVATLFSSVGKEPSYLNKHSINFVDYFSGMVSGDNLSCKTKTLVTRNTPATIHQSKIEIFCNLLLTLKKFYETSFMFLM